MSIEVEVIFSTQRAFDVETSVKRASTKVFLFSVDYTNPLLNELCNFISAFGRLKIKQFNWHKIECRMI